MGNCCPTHGRAMKILRSPLVARRRCPVSTAVCTSSAGRSEARALRSSLCDDVARPVESKIPITRWAAGVRGNYPTNTSRQPCKPSCPFATCARCFRVSAVACSKCVMAIKSAPRQCSRLQGTSLSREAKHCAFACDVSVLCRCRYCCSASRAAGPDVGACKPALCASCFMRLGEDWGPCNHTRPNGQGALGCAVASKRCTIDDSIKPARSLLCVPCMQARVPASHTAGYSWQHKRVQYHAYISVTLPLYVYNALRRGRGRTSPALLLQVPTACLQGLFKAKAPAASFSARLVSTTRPIMHILLSTASVAEDRVSPHLTLPRAGTLAPGLV